MNYSKKCLNYCCNYYRYRCFHHGTTFTLYFIISYSFIILLPSQPGHILCYKVFAINMQERMGYTKQMSELVPHAPFHTSTVQALQLSLQYNNCLSHFLMRRDQWVTQTHVRAGASCPFSHLQFKLINWFYNAITAEGICYKCAGTKGLHKTHVWAGATCTFLHYYSPSSSTGFAMQCKHCLRHKL